MTTIFKRNELTWYPIPQSVQEEREALERLQAALHDRPQFVKKGSKQDEAIREKDDPEPLD